MLFYLRRYLRPAIGLFVVLICAVFLRSPARADYGTAEDITDECVISGCDSKACSKLTDDDYNSTVSFDKASSVEILSPYSTSGIYIVWHLTPGEWTLTLDGEETVCGKDGFLHEYIPTSGARELVINVPDDSTLCDIYVLGEGALPDWVQVWSAPYEQADILLLPTHADDEELFFAGILPTYSQEYGYKVQVAYITAHLKERWRYHELLNGLWYCGIRAYPVFSEIEDFRAYKSMYKNAVFEEYEVMLLRRFKPAVAVIHDLNGEYGHVTHIQGAKQMLNAIVSAADESKYPESAQEYGTWELPKLYIHLYKTDSEPMNWHVPLRSYDGECALDVAVEGYGFHESQHIYWFEVREYGNCDCRIFGLYRSTVGDDTGTDLMENTGIAPSKGLAADMGGINADME